MAKAPTILYIPQAATREQIVEILADGVLAKRFEKQLSHMQPELRRQLLLEMAEALVTKADACSNSHFLRDARPTSLLNQPSDEECAAFEEAVKEIVIVRQGRTRSPARSGIRSVVGHLWAGIRELVGAPDWEELQRREPKGSWAGPRG